MTGHRCPTTHKPMLSHQRALKSARWWQSQGRTLIAYPCEECGHWHTRYAGIAEMRAATTRTKESA